MNLHDAEKELDRVVRELGERPNSYWRERVEGEPIAWEVKSALGVQYQVEVQVFWDDKAGGDIRVICQIDDGGIRAFFPLTKSFLVRVCRPNERGTGKATR